MSTPYAGFADLNSLGNTPDCQNVSVHCPSFLAGPVNPAHCCENGYVHKKMAILEAHTPWKSPSAT